VKLPDRLAKEISSKAGRNVVAADGVGGGCISDTARVQLEDGDVAFLKWSSPGEHPAEMLVEEAKSLRAIGATQTLRVPTVLAQHAGAAFSWLLLEWLEPGPRTKDNQRLLGQQLAALHRNSSATYGWDSENFIGSLPQSNTAHRDWSGFWRGERLLPQLRMAEAQLGVSGIRRFDALLRDLPSLLRDVEDEGPSLLHGDLWSGNVHMLADGSPAVIDPSCYYGHREVDIAMSRLFGGFSTEFYEAYAESWPHRQGLEERVLLYQLYYLLVHINLFGGSYVQQTLSVLKQLGY
jgi:protein-ribulosamine 3-kinase